MSRVAVVSCPTCGAAVRWEAASTARPFCSARCRLIDLGAWLDEERRIPDPEAAAEGLTPPAEPDWEPHVPSG